MRILCYYLCALVFILIIADCGKTAVEPRIEDPFAFIEGPYDCECEQVYRDIDIINGGWVETRDSFFHTDTLTVIDSLHFEFWNGKFECDLFSSDRECSDGDYLYMLRIPTIHLLLDEKTLTYKEKHNSASGPIHGFLTCRCIKQQ